MLQYIRAAQQLRKSDRGASAVEYGILVAAIAAVIVALVFALGTQVKGGFKTTCDAMKTGGAAATACP
jgi:pilus assembly protein Flp/PilA